MKKSKEKNKRWIIAIDGPSAAGKSTLGKALARRYDLIYIDTGAMYRAVALLASKMGILWSDEKALIELTESKPIEIHMKNDSVKVCIDGHEVTDLIRTPEMGSGASQISALPGVKRAMIRKQQEMGNSGGVIMDGRDIGTFVFPQADFKFYLDASVETRGLRRYNELKAKGMDISLDEIIKSMKVRDHTDSHRAVAPLQIAADAMVIDTTNLSIQQVLEVIIDRIDSLSKNL
ncbi:MAG: (d)CMP kinase [bacterium]